MRILEQTSASVGRGPWSGRTALTDGWLYAVLADDGKPALVIAPESDVNTSVQARQSVQSMDLDDFSNEALGFAVRQHNIASITKATRLWGPNTIVDVTFNYNRDEGFSPWLVRWATGSNPGVQPRMIVSLTGPRGRIKAIAGALGWQI